MNTDTKKTNIRSGSLRCGMLALALLTGSLSGTSMGAVIYTEAFANSGSNKAMTHADWKAAMGSASATTDYTTTGVTNPGVGISSASDGFVLGYLRAAAPYGLIYTEEFSFSSSAYTDLTFSWRQANSNTNTTFHVAIKMDGAWYVSATGFANTTAATSYAGMEVKEYQFTNAANSWHLLNLDFAPGGSLGLGALRETPLPSGTITGFGLYAIRNVSDTTLRLDDFTITATPIPEPATGTLLLGLVTGLVVTVRRRGNRNR